MNDSTPAALNPAAGHSSIPCKKCLLADVPKGAELAALIYNRIENIPKELRCPNEQYQLRLNQCIQCDMLVSGMCRKCGCYAELRAAYVKNHCPSEHHYW